MALDRQVLAIPFAKGVDTQPDPKQVEVGKLLVAQNVIFETPKTLKKKFGWVALGSGIVGGGTITTPRGLGLVGDTLAAFDDARAYLWESAQTKWLPGGAAFTGEVRTVPVYRGDIAMDEAVTAYDWTNNTALSVWKVTQTGGASFTLYWQAVEMTTGVPLAPMAALDLSAAGQTYGTNLRLVYFAAGSAFVLGFVGGSGAACYYLKFTRSGGVVTAGAPVSVNAQTVADCFDMTMAPSGGSVFFAYYNGGGTSGLRSLNSVYTLSGASTPALGGTPSWQSIWTSGNSVYVGTLQAGVTRVLVLSMAFAVTTADQAVATYTNARRVVGCENGAGSYILTECNNGTNTWVRCDGISGGGAVTASTRAAVNGYGIACRPYYSTLLGYPVLALTCDSLLQPHVALVKIARVDVRAGTVGESQAGEALVYMGRVMYQQAAGLMPLKCLPDVAFNESSGSPALAVSSLYVTRRVGGGLGQSWGAGAFPDVDKGVAFSRWDRSTTAQVQSSAGMAHATGAALWQFDGQSCVEQGFPAFPEHITASEYVAGGLGAGPYSYRFMWEWVDALGQVHRSAPSAAVTFTPSGAGKGMIPRLDGDFAFVCLTNKVNVKLVMYRNAGVGGGTPGSIYYRVQAVPYSQYRTPSNIIDTAADSTLLANEQLYTTGGEVPNTSPPPSVALTQHKSRVILVPSENRRVFWFTKQMIPGTPPEFSDLLTFSMDERGGDNTAVLPMDEKLIVFKRNHIFAVVGDGPAADGSQNDFAQYLISSDTGCLSQASVVLTPKGIMFQGPKGIYLLDRALNLEFIGSDVTAYTSALVTSAVLSKTTREARFTLNDGTALVYNYNFDAWSVFTNVGAIASTFNSDAWTWATSAGAFRYESQNAYTEQGTAVARTIETAWLSLANLEAFQRIRRLVFLYTANAATTGDVTIKIRYDFVETDAQTSVVTAAMLKALAANSIGGAVRVHLARQKCSAIKIIISDNTATNDAGVDWSALTLEAGVKRGTNKLPAANTVG